MNAVEGTEARSSANIRANSKTMSMVGCIERSQIDQHRVQRYGLLFFPKQRLRLRVLYIASRAGEWGARSEIGSW